MRSETYRVSVGGAAAEFYVLTKQEFIDFERLKERPVLESLLRELRPDDVFYDLGANIGLYTCLAADIVDTTVVAFEPHPRNTDRLEGNASLNGADVSIHDCALAASSGTAELRLAPGFDLGRLGSAGHSLLDYTDEETGTVAVEKRVGDEFVEEADLQPPSALKIDVEGVEMEVLRGFESTLSRPDCRLVYCEIHEDRLELQGYSISAVAEFLESCNFDVEQQVIEGYQPFLRAEKPAANTSPTR